MVLIPIKISKKVLYKFLQCRYRKHLEISRTFFPKIVTGNQGSGLSVGIFEKVASGVQFSIFASDLMPGY